MYIKSPICTYYHAIRDEVGRDITWRKTGDFC